MLGNLTLMEHDVLFRIDAAGKKRGGDLTGRLRQLGRVLPHRDRVQIDHAVDAVVLVLQRDKLHERAEIIAEVQIAGRLHAGKYPLLERHAGILVGYAATWHDPRPARKRSPGWHRGGMRHRFGPRVCLEEHGRYSAPASWVGVS